MNNMINAEEEKVQRQPHKKLKPYYRSLPPIRDDLAGVLTVLIASIFLLVSLFSASKHSLVTVLLTNASLISCILVVVEGSTRILLAIQEWSYIATRYDNSFQCFFSDLLHPSLALKATFLVAVFSTLVVYIRMDAHPWILWCSFGPESMVCSLLGILFLERVLKLYSGPLNESLWISNSKGLDYGSGMAHSFFHGYLKLIIPKTGSEEKNLEELMKDYEDEHRVQLNCYKLFILIPKSLHCPVSLKDVSTTIEESTSLRKKELTVAGVQKRVYKNSVYKIVGRNNTRIYLAAEYATPLKTFNDVVNHNGEHSNNYKKHKNEIVLQFYLTLQKVLNEFKSCTDFCELIFYDDVKQIDPDGKTIYHDVGEILLNRLKEIKRRNRTFPQVIAKLGNRWKEIVFFSFAIIPVVVGIFCHITSHPTVD